MNIEECLYKSIIASVEAGKKIMEIYNDPEADFETEKKDDNSPVTIADKKAHEIILQNLSKIEIPVLSEEGKNISFEQRKNWDYYFLVDPLDGTKEFLKKNGEFTVNIAVIKQKRAFAGVVYLPVLKTLYFADDKASFKIENLSDDLSSKTNLNDFIKESKKLKPESKPADYTIIGSRSHQNDELKKFIEEKEKIHGKIDFISAGSSLKFCKMAEGLAHIYPRTGRTMEWDTAAGHAVCKRAGLVVKNMFSDEELIYNKKDLSNPYFIVE
ncbi:MAG: 3'(2'),5'-bisphosphate nucleotidase CysQ [Desulfobacteraceae bacterium]|nr:3'(2'),5'-bisphosphate nucleotidase CysQ [Desulfobacteraceae bacterium]